MRIRGFNIFAATQISDFKDRLIIEVHLTNKTFQKKDDTRLARGIATDFALGAASGIIMGLITGQLALWLSIGSGIGIAAGALIASDIF